MGLFRFYKTYFPSSRDKTESCCFFVCVYFHNTHIFGWDQECDAAQFSVCVCVRVRMIMSILKCELTAYNRFKRQWSPKKNVKTQEKKMKNQNYSLVLCVKMRKTAINRRDMNHAKSYISCAQQKKRHEATPNRQYDLSQRCFGRLSEWEMNKKKSQHWSNTSHQNQFVTGHCSPLI